MPAVRVLLVAAPASAAAALGLAHPVFLTPSTAVRWQLTHLALLPVFPLLGASIWHLVRRDRGPLGWLARGAAFAYAVLYGALDAIAGLGAPEQVRQSGSDAPIGDLYSVGDRLGHAGVVCLAASLVLAAALSWRRARSPLSLAAGAIAAGACWPFYLHHVFWPRGVLAMIGIALGLALLAASDPEDVPSD